MMGLKTNSAFVALVMGAAGLVSACYPLEESSLVYASTHQVGVSVSAGTVASPGLDLSLGYKGLDIAMVPVAVAKFCETARQDVCNDALYTMRVISGGRQETTDNTDLLKRIDANNTTADRNDSSRTQNINKISEIDTKLAKSDKLLILDNRIAAITNELLTADVEQAIKLEYEKANKTAEAVALTEFRRTNVQTLRIERARLLTENFGLDVDIARDRSEANKLTQQMRAGTAGRRDDALSVYGTFSGQTEGGNTEARLGAGKVFATGVAAQNLSETAGAANCLAAIAVLANKVTGITERDLLISRSHQLCISKPNGN